MAMIIPNKTAEKMQMLLARNLGLKSEQVTEFTVTTSDPEIAEIRYEGIALITIEEFNDILAEASR